MNLQKYINHLKNKNLATGTIQLYTKILQKHQPLTLNTVNIQKIFQQNLTKYEANYLSLKQQIFKSYAKFRRIKVNWEKIVRIIPKVQRKYFATINELELNKLKAVQIEEELENYHRNNLMLDFLFYTGIRVSELVNLKHRDYSNRMLRILGKGNKIRYVFCPEFLANQINPFSNGHLFTTSNGKPIRPEWVIQIIHKRTQLAGIQKRITPHSFRRSFATNLYNRGGKLETIQKQLGHASLDTTMAYIHNDYETLYQDYSKLWIKSPTANYYDLPK